MALQRHLSQGSCLVTSEFALLSNPDFQKPGTVFGDASFTVRTKAACDTTFGGTCGVRGLTAWPSRTRADEGRAPRCCAPCVRPACPHSHLCARRSACGLPWVLVHPDHSRVTKWSGLQRVPLGAAACLRSRGAACTLTTQGCGWGALPQLAIDPRLPPVIKNRLFRCTINS